MKVLEAMNAKKEKKKNQVTRHITSRVGGYIEWETPAKS